MTDSQPRIVSLLPSATEILAALGLTDAIVGRSHECDFPSQVQRLPVCTQPKFNPEGSSREIHERATDLLQSALSVYQIETDNLKQLQPTHIVTQAQCEVCAVSLTEVERAVGDLVGVNPQIISLQPHLLADVWNDILRVAQVFGADGDAVVGKLKSRVSDCASKTESIDDRSRPRVACLEWTDPLMAAGNWIPELVELAGAHPLVEVPGQHAPTMAWDAFVATDPDIIVLMPCGFDLDRAREAAEQLAQRSEWEQLQAVRNNRVYLTDGNQYFNRPGPRLVDSLEILAEIIHPDLFDFGYRGTGWEPMSS